MTIIENLTERMESMKLHVKWAQEDLEQEERHFKTWVESATAFDIVHAGDSKLRRVREASEAVERYSEKLRMIEAMLKMAKECEQ